MPDRPDPPEVKLVIRRALAVRSGKLWDEALERRVLGLPGVANPEFIPEDPRRAKQTQAEDLAGRRELEDMAKQAERNDLALQLRERDDRIAELERQVRALMGESGPAARLVTPAAATAVAPAGLPGEQPDDTWTMRQILQWGEDRGIRVPTAGRYKTKREAANFIMQRLAERETDPEPEDKDTPFDPSVPEAQRGAA